MAPRHIRGQAKLTEAASRPAKHALKQAQAGNKAKRDDATKQESKFKVTKTKTKAKQSRHGDHEPTSLTITWSYVRGNPRFKPYEKLRRTVLMSTPLSFVNDDADQYLQEASLDMNANLEDLILIATGEWELEQWNRARRDAVADNGGEVDDRELTPMPMDALPVALTRCYHRGEVDPELDTTRYVLMRKEQAFHFAICDEVSRMDGAFSNRWMNLDAADTIVVCRPDGASFIRLSLLVKH